MDLEIEVVAGPSQGMSLTLHPGDRIEVGRASQTSLCIANDCHMSRHHVLIEYDGQHCRVQDLGSANGTFVNGSRIESVNVDPGTSIGIGNSILLLHAHSKNTGDRVLTHLHSPQRAERSAQDISVPPALPTIEPARAPVRPDPVVTNATSFPVAPLFWFDADAVPKLTVIVKASYTITADGTVQPAAKPLPIFQTTKYFRDEPQRSVLFETDLVPFKPRADVVLVGRAHAPDGNPVTWLDVTLRVGSINRTLRVIGDRQWLLSASGTDLTLSNPQSFIRMPLIYERAYGGTDPASGKPHPENPIGRGYIEEFSPKTCVGAYLPNIEDPADPIIRWDSRPKPVGFGFIDRNWAGRKSQSASDHNAAHPDLQIDGYLKGDESVELINLTSDGSVEFVLPKEHLGAWLRPVETEDSSEGMDITDLATLQHGGRIGERGRFMLDTLVLLPEKRTFYTVYRAVFDLAKNPPDKPVEIAIIA